MKKAGKKAGVVALWVFGLASLVMAFSGCAIKVYLVDRQTVLEDEAAGEWPEFEKQILTDSQASTPEPLGAVASSAGRGRLLNILNGEQSGRGK